MKSILGKLELNSSTYLFFFLSFLCGYFKPIFFIFLLLLIHELGHIVTIKLSHYKIIKVEFFPFGGITTIEKPINSSIQKEMLISLSGCMAQLILMLFLSFFYHKGWLNIQDYQLFRTYNKIIFFFNLLPIIPLDGSIFLHSFFEKFYPYQKALFYYELISFFSFLLFFFYNIFCHVNNYFICAVLLYQFYLLKKQEKYLIHRFYLERYLYEFPYQKIKNHQTKDLKKLQKETLHFFWEKDHYLSEKELLRKYFQNLQKKYEKK